jgi:hypothetical protein
MPLTISPELQSLIPPLTAEEHAQLERNLLAEGCRDPIVTWAEEQVVLDGHHRLQICEQYGLVYRIQELSLPDLDAAKAWMIAHQLGRRNLTPDQMAYYRGKQYNLQKQRHGGDRKSDGSSTQDGYLKTADRLAREHGVSKNTIARDAVYANALDTIVDVVGPEAQRALLARETKVTPHEVKQLGKIAQRFPQTIQTVLDAVQRAKTPKQARQMVRAKVGEVREYDERIERMMRSQPTSDAGEQPLTPPPPPSPRMQQQAWDLGYLDELERRLTKALDSLDHLHAYLSRRAEQELAEGREWLGVQLSALLEHESALCLRVSQCWGRVEMFLRRSETVCQGIVGLPPEPAPEAAVPAPPEPDCPPFDPAVYILGKLCKAGHAWGTTGKSLLRIKGRYCPVCNSAIKREKRKEQSQAVDAP